jgi:hypothetical protein
MSLLFEIQLKTTILLGWQCVRRAKNRGLEGNLVKDGLAGRFTPMVKTLERMRFLSMTMMVMGSRSDP